MVEKEMSVEKLLENINTTTELEWRGSILSVSIVSISKNLGNLYIRDWVNMKTAKNKYKHAKKETFQTQTAGALHRGEEKQDARLKTCLREVDEMEYFSQLQAVQLWFESKTRSSKDEFST